MHGESVSHFTRSWAIFVYYLSITCTLVCFFFFLGLVVSPFHRIQQHNVNLIIFFVFIWFFVCLLIINIRTCFHAYSHLLDFNHNTQHISLSPVYSMIFQLFFFFVFLLWLQKSAKHIHKCQIKLFAKLKFRVMSVLATIEIHKHLFPNCTKPLRPSIHWCYFNHLFMVRLLFLYFSLIISSANKTYSIASNSS